MPYLREFGDEKINADALSFYLDRTRKNRLT
jgi:hypothetical protein